MVDGDPLASSREAFHSLNFRWLMVLRWAAVVGQTLAVAVVQWWIGIPLPLALIAPIIGAEVVLNLAALRVNRTRRSVGELELAGWVALDLIAFTILLFLSGGPTNPFSFFYIVHVAMAALTLRPLYTWGLVGLSAIGYAALFVWHIPLDTAAGPHWDREDIFLHGSWVAYALGSSCIAYFLHRARRALKQQEELLLEQRELGVQAERLSSLATLAAGAAHELANPLSTIAVVSKELEHDLTKLLGDSEHGKTAVEDVSLVRNQVERCRKILGRMAHTAGEAPGEADSWITLRDLLEEALAELPDKDAIDREVAPELHDAELRCPKEALAQALRVLVDNALDASEGRVQVMARSDADGVRIEVSDTGEGMPHEVLLHAFEPFFTTKPPGKGMGLGLFLARNVAGRLGGGLTLESKSGQGTVAGLWLPPERLRKAEASSSSAEAHPFEPDPAVR